MNIGIYLSGPDEARALFLRSFPAVMTYAQPRPPQVEGKWGQSLQATTNTITRTRGYDAMLGKREGDVGIFLSILVFRR